MLSNLIFKISTFLPFNLELAAINKPDLFLGMSIMSDDFYKLVFRFFLNLIFITLIIRFIYFVKTPRRNYLFTFYLISVITFMICFALKKARH